MNKMNCELCCKKRANMYCESDQASLCWDCDWKVHSANFLVAKHSRNLLCNSCQNQTPWSASGSKLSPTLSVCNSCLENPADAGEENYQTETDNDDEDEDEYESSESEIDEDDDGNQVVPLSSSPSNTFSPVTSSGSYGDLSVTGEGGVGVSVGAVAVSSSPWKRIRESDCLHSEDEEACSSSLNCNNLLEENKGTSSSIGFLRPMKVLRTNEFCEY